MLQAWDTVDADCHREEASLSPLAFFSGVLPPPVPPPSVRVDDRTGLASVFFSLREGADELGVLLALAELVQIISSNKTPVSIVPLRRERGERGLRLSAGDAAAEFLSASAAAPPKVELTAPSSSLVAASSSPLENLFRASNAVVSSLEEGADGEGEGHQRRRSFARTWTWHSGGNDDEGKDNLRGEVVAPLLRGVDEAFRQSLEELFGPLEGEEGKRERKEAG